MAGTYPDPPGHRLAYHIDGTVVVIANRAFNTVKGTASTLEMNGINSDHIGSNRFDGDNALAFIFPHLMDLTGVLVNLNVSRTGYYMEVSSNTTNGIDGSWRTASISGFHARDLTGVLREGIYVMNETGVRAIRLNEATSAAAKRNIHLYGSISPDSDAEKLNIWLPYDDQKASPAYLDWGDIRRGEYRHSQFRVKNISRSKAAIGNAIEFEALTPSGSKTSVTGHELSSDGIIFSPTLNLPPLQPEEISDLIHVRYNTGALDSVGAKWCYAKLMVEEWI